MKRFKKGITLLLALSTMFAICISASATDIDLVESDSKTADVGTTATIKGELWTYNTVDNGVSWMEPTAKTIVSSSKTMAQVTVDLECKYQDTGKLVSSNAEGFKSANNKNTVKVDLIFSVPRSAPVIAFTAHEATYSRSDVLYMSSRL